MKKFSQFENYGRLALGQQQAAQKNVNLGIDVSGIVKRHKPSPKFVSDNKVLFGAAGASLDSIVGMPLVTNTSGTMTRYSASDVIKTRV